MIFNSVMYENSMPDGIGVLEIADPSSEGQTLVCTSFPNKSHRDDNRTSCHVSTDTGLLLHIPIL